MDQEVIITRISLGKYHKPDVMPRKQFRYLPCVLSVLSSVKILLTSLNVALLVGKGIILILTSPLFNMLFSFLPNTRG